MVDALDGVKVCIPEDVNDTAGNINLEAGTRTVKGDEALDYVRVRHGIGERETGDLGRMKRQQAFRSEESRAGTEGGSECRTRRSPFHEKKNRIHYNKSHY